ncbi:MAG: hypothetical protein ACXWQO_18055 [Bdellovibrionota bacterium]
MEHTEINHTNEHVQTNSVPAEKVKWGIKVRCDRESRSFEVKITLPMGEEDNLPVLLEQNVIAAFPEIMRALESGRLPGNEIDLANRH